MNPIGTTFNKENIVLATMICPMTQDENEWGKEGPDYFHLKDGDCLTTVDGKFNLKKENGEFTREIFDIFYQTKDGYVRFLDEGNEIISDEKLYNIVSAWKYYSEFQMAETENKKGETAICELLNESEFSPILRYNEDVNILK